MAFAGGAVDGDGAAAVIHAVAVATALAIAALDLPLSLVDAMAAQYGVDAARAGSINAAALVGSTIGVLATPLIWRWITPIRAGAAGALASGALAFAAAATADPAAALAERFLSGLCAGPLLAAAPALLRARLPGPRLACGFAALTAGATVGLAAAPSLGVAVYAVGGAQAVGVAAALCATGAAAVMTLAGQAGASGAARGPRPPATWGVRAAQAPRAHPRESVRVALSRAAAAAACARACGYAALYLAMTQGPAVLVGAMGRSPGDAATCLLAAAAIALAAPFCARRWRMGQDDAAVAAAAGKVAVLAAAAAALAAGGGAAASLALMGVWLAARANAAPALDAILAREGLCDDALAFVFAASCAAGGAAAFALSTTLALTPDAPRDLALAVAALSALSLALTPSALAPRAA